MAESRNGRKFKMGLYLIMAAIAGFIAVMVLPHVGPYFATFLGGLTATYAVYCGGNIGTHMAYTRPAIKIVQDRRKEDREEDSTQKGPGPAETGYTPGVP